MINFCVLKKEKKSSSMRFKRCFVCSIVICAFVCFPVFSVESGATEVFSAENSAREIGKNEQMAKADSFFEAALYDRAIPLYEQIVLNREQIPGADNPFSGLAFQRLLQSYFLSGKYAQVISLAPDIGSDQQNLYILGLSYIRSGDYTKGITALKKYLAADLTDSQFFREEAELELGKAFFMAGNFAESKALLENLQTQNRRIRFLSSLYLARVALAEEDPDKAENLLSQLQQEIPKDEVLRYEIAYLRGEAAFQNGDYILSVQHFQDALPENNPEKMDWYRETNYHLGWSYVKLGDDPEKSAAEQKQHFDSAEVILKKLLESSVDERTLLALGQSYLARARLLKEEAAYQNAEALFSRQDTFVSPEARAHALLLLAEAAPTYIKRDTLYRHLTQEGNRGTPFYSKGWYLRGLNDLDEGKALLQNHQDDEARKAFERSISSFQKAFEHLQYSDEDLAGLALKYQVQAFIWQDTEQKYLQALAKLEEINGYPHIISALDDPDEIYCLKALAAARLAEKNNDPKYAAMADQTIRQGLEKFPKGQFADDQLKLLGTLYYHQQAYSKAEETFLRLAGDFPDSPLGGEALYWAARCADARQDAPAAREYRRQVFEKHPECSYAPEAYFTYYSFRDYLQGDRDAVKHLQSMADLFPQSSYLVHAWYLVGLDYERDRKTEAGKWIRKKNMTAAIDAFQETEAVFDTLLQQNRLPVQELDYLTMIRYRAVLERALANLAIANGSQGAKRQIYLEYAEEVLKQIVKDCRNDQHPLKQHISSVKAHGRLEDESCYWLAQAYSKSNNDADAEKILNEMLDKYKSAKITRGYFLSRTWYDKGMIALRRNDPAIALQSFQSAEDAAKGNVLNTEEKLDLWIQQSLGFQAQHDLDNAILILSKVVNDDSISSLRVKAMYLRAEAYELQGRRDLARKQLEATAKKGGEWAVKAKAKLDKQYGYQ